jgi:hypothetical protein
MLRDDFVALMELSGDTQAGVKATALMLSGPC